MKGIFSYVLVAVIYAAPCFGAISSKVYDGTEDGFWNNHAVIVAQVVKVDRGRLENVASVNVLQVLESPNDIPRTTMVLSYAMNMFDGKDGLVKGDMGIMCIRKREDEWILPSHAYRFFESRSTFSQMTDPNGPDSNSAFAKITGLEDPKVKAMVERIAAIKRRIATKPSDAEETIIAQRLMKIVDQMKTSWNGKDWVSFVGIYDAASEERKAWEKGGDAKQARLAILNKVRTSLGEMKDLRFRDAIIDKLKSSFVISIFYQDGTEHLVELDFIPQSDGSWRLREADIFPPVKEKRE